VLGGDPGTIERAVIASDGSLGPFTQSPYILGNMLRFESTVTQIGTALYVLGENTR